MPTFRNDTGEWQDFELTLPGRGRVLVRFEPGERRELEFWLPWREKGLTLVSADPPVPPEILTSGTFNFSAGMERTFQIPPCEKYVLDLIVQRGRVRLFAGDAKVGAEVVKSDVVPFRYRDVYEWERAPFLRLVGMEDKTRATLHVEAGFAGRIEDLPCR